MGMDHWEWKGMGLKKTFPLISSVNRALSSLRKAMCCRYVMYAAVIFIPTRFVQLLLSVISISIYCFSCVDFKPIG